MTDREKLHDFLNNNLEKIYEFVMKYHLPKCKECQQFFNDYNNKALANAIKHDPLFMDKFKESFDV